MEIDESTKFLRLRLWRIHHTHQKCYIFVKHKEIKDLRDLRDLFDKFLETR